MDFNEAMLAKQVWRILKNLDLFVSRLLKARYFPSCDLLKAKVGHRPSYVWRSIWSCLWVIEKGCRWIVGNGNSINIWDDPWLSKPPSFKAISPRINNTSYVKVGDIIDHETMKWKVDIVKEIFIPFKAEEILNTPIPSHPTDDIVAWGYTKSGLFTVKSAYHFINIVKGENIDEASSSSHTRLWQQIKFGVFMFSLRSKLSYGDCVAELYQQLKAYIEE